MKLIVCVDDRYGMAFNGRRQSKDCVLRKQVLELVGKNLLWMNGYSARQFEDRTENMRVSDDYLQMAGQEDYCFVETEDVTPHIALADTVILYHWNRTYPADLYFCKQLLSEDWQLLSTRDFPGNSHEMITQEVYVR